MFDCKVITRPQNNCGIVRK